MRDQLINRRDYLLSRFDEQNLRIERILAQNPKDTDQIVKVQTLLNELQNEIKSITKILDKSAFA